MSSSQSSQSDSDAMSPVISHARSCSETFLQKFSFGVCGDDDMTFERIQYSRRLDENYEVWKPNIHIVFIDFDFRFSPR